MNTLTGLLDFIHESVDIVSREQVGMIPSVAKSTSADQVGKDQDITYSVVDDATAYDITPASAVPALDTSTVSAGTMSISKVRGVKFHWTGEDEAKLQSSVKEEVENNKIASAFRTLINEMESDLAGLYPYASRAYGTPGTTPFATAGDFTDAAEVMRILKDNGAPNSELRLVLNSAAEAKMIGKQSQVHMSGSDDPLRRGVLLDLAGAQVRASAQIKDHTKGTGAGFLVNDGDDLAIGDILVGADTGSGTILAGDVATFAGNTDKYIVGSALAAGSLSLNNPGVRAAVLDGAAITVGNSYAANMAFAKSAIHLVTRLPKIPKTGDAAADRYQVQDPVSGIWFEIALYPVYRAVLIEVAVAWGVKAAKPAHIAALLG